MCEHWRSSTTADDPFPQTAVDVAGRLTECVRDLNYATTPSGSLYDPLQYPSEAYGVVGELDTATRRLPQAYQQLRQFLEFGLDPDLICADYGTPKAHLAAADAALRDATEASTRMAQALSRAHCALAPLGYQ